MTAFDDTNGKKQNLPSSNSPGRTSRKESSSKPLTDEQLSHTFEQLAILLSAGITPSEGLSVMLKDKDNNDLAAVYTQLLALVREGKSLADSMQETGVFPSYSIQLLHIGELTGRTDVVCSSLSSYYETEDALHISVRDAFYYPMIMAVMMFVLVIVLLSRVLPIFEQIFRQMGTTASGVSAALMAISEVLSRYYALFVVFFFLLAILFFYFNNTPRGGQKLRRFMEIFPPTRGLSESIAIARFASAMELTQASGMDTYESLELCLSVTENRDISERIRRCISLLQEGQVLSDALAGAGIFSSFYSGMIRVAAMSGSIDVVMGYIARHYREDADRRIDSALARIEPAMVAVLAIVIGLILLSVILPLMGIMSSLG